MKRNKLERIINVIIFITNKITPTIHKKCKFEVEKFAINEINKAITEAIDEYGYSIIDNSNLLSFYI